MAIVTGQCRTDSPAPSGISARIYDGIVSRAAWAGMVALTAGTPARDALAAVVEAVAQGILNTLVTDARVTVIIRANSLGAGIPAADVEITDARIV